MAELSNIRHERFAQHIAAGLGLEDAYSEAGYIPLRSSALKLRKKPEVVARIMEINPDYKGKPGRRKKPSVFAQIPSQKKGRIYAFRHPDNDRLFKIGYTNRPVEVRLKEISQLSPAPYKQFRDEPVCPAHVAERYVHELLEENRIEGKELFECTPYALNKAFDEAVRRFSSRPEVQVPQFLSSISESFASDNVRVRPSQRAVSVTVGADPQSGAPYDVEVPFAQYETMQATFETGKAYFDSLAAVKQGG